MAKAAATNRDESPAAKRPAYPYYSWTQCVKLATAVKDLGGDRSFVTPGDIAHRLQVAEDSAMLSQLTASARTYGLIEGRGSYKLTDTAKGFFFPIDDAEKRKAELMLFKTPTAYSALVSKYDGGVLPPVAQIANVLKRECGVPTSWVNRAASLFRDACAKLSLVDQGGHLRYAVAARTGVRIDSPDADSEAPPEPDMDETTDQKRDPTRKTNTPSSPPPKHDETLTVWTAPGPNGTVRVELPSPLSSAQWKRLRQYVDAMKPFAEEGEDDGSK